MSKRIVVLMGGLSSEREVSLETGSAVTNSLKNMGYDVTSIDVNRGVAKALYENKPDLVFNALHGTYGEDGCIQGLLELMGIPYTHSGVLASATAMDKPTARILFESTGIRCARGEVLSFDDITRGKCSIKPPLVVKPTNDGSSVGVIIVDDGKKLDSELISTNPGDNLLIEEFIPGMELSVAVLDGKALGVIEIRPKDSFYNYKNKYTKGMTEYIMPASIETEVAKEAMDMSEKAHEILGCRGVSRADLRYDNTPDGDGNIYMLEVNTHPGMTPLSLVPKIADHVGIDFESLVKKLLKTAKYENC